MNSTYKRFSLLFSLGLFCLLCACREKPAASGGNQNNTYSIYIMGKDGREYLLQSNSLDSGVLLPEKSGTEVDRKLIDRSLIAKDGYYYHYDRKSAAFVKYSLSDRKLNAIKSVPLKQFSLENYLWLGGDTLLLTGLTSPDFAEVRYLLLSTDEMKTIAEGVVPVPAPSGRFDNMSVGFVQVRKNKLLLGYTYHQDLGNYNYTTSDTAYFSILDYPQMNLVSTTKDSRSTYPGGINAIQSSSFTDEQQDFYFMDCPGIALGNRPELKTAILRIRKGEETPDQHYFFDFSAAAGNHAYGMWYLGNGQAIVRAERKDLFKGLGDHYSTPHFEFYLADLKQARILKKLNLPLDKGTRRECVLVKDGIAYISLNSSAAGNFIWQYNIGTGALKKGLQLAGNTDFILRIDQLR